MKIYHNPRCSKSRETLKLIEDSGANVEIIEYLKTPLKKAELESLVKALGITATELVRKKEKIIKEEGIDISTDAKAISAMIKHPTLIERPIVVKGKKAVLGRPPENVKTFL